MRVRAQTGGKSVSKGMTRMNQARKRTGTKKVLSMILVLVMLLSLLSMAAFTLPASETGNSKDSYDYKSNVR